MKTDYSKIDAAILAAIRAGKRQFYLFQGDEAISKEVKEVKCPLPNSEDDFRIIDRRLQALRRTGRVVFSGGNWNIKED